MMKNFAIYMLLMVLFAACGTEQKESKDAPKKQTSESIRKLHSIEATPEQDSLLELVNQKIREDLDNPDLYVERSDIYLDIGDVDAAVKDLDRSYRLDSTNYKTLMAQADFFTRGGKLEASMRILEKAKIYHPEESDLYLRMAEIYLIAKSNKKSLENADLAVKYNMYNAKAYYIKAYNFLDMGDTARAISSFRTSVEQNPDYYEGYLQLGLLFSELRDPLAIDYFNNALEIRPNDRDALYARGMFEQEHDMLNEAMKTYTQAIKAHPDFREAYYNMGYLHMYYLKLYSEALKYFDQAVQVDPQYYQAYYNRGYSFELMGDINNAALDYKKALQIQPDYTLAAQGLERVGGSF